MEQRNGKQETEQKKEKELLKKYLGQYYAGRIKRVQLERRLKTIQREMEAPVGGIGYSPVNYRNKNSIGPGAASFVYRMGEIETRIQEQKEKIEKALLKIMDIMDFLKENSTERMVLELRFIDCKKWEVIEKELHLSRRACFDYQNRALERLLEFKKVQTILKEYEKRD